MKDTTSLNQITGGDPQNPDRRQHTVGAILALLTGVTITIAPATTTDR
jgi:hypothetical protein